MLSTGDESHVYINCLPCLIVYSISEQVSLEHEAKFQLLGLTLARVVNGLWFFFTFVFCVFCEMSELK